MVKFSKPYESLFDLLEAFPDEEACIKHLERIRWPDGVIVCGHCGSSRKIHRVTRGHLYKCADCKKQFSVRKGTIFEESRLPLRKWFAAFWLVTTQRKGSNSCQLHREIGVTQKTAWFMLGRIRKVAGKMRSDKERIRGEVEADETFLGGKEKNKHADQRRYPGGGGKGKQVVAGLRSREGEVGLMQVEDTSKATLQGFVYRNVAAGATVYTDEHCSYMGLGETYNHQSVCHAVGEYVSGDIHTNSIESFWAILKRGYYGVFHHFTWKHLHRCLAEFETRWNMSGLQNGERMDALLEYISGLRLTYKGLITA